MRNIHFAVLSMLVVSAFLFQAAVCATPSTVYWTAGTADIQPYKVPHITVDNYVSDDSNFPPDFGLTVGLLPFERIQMEVGIDVLEPTDDPLYFNAKVGMPEGKMFDGSPAWSLGIWNLGTKRHVTDYDVLQVAFTKTLPNNLGRIHLGGYYGITDTLAITASDGDGDRGGFTVGYDKFIWKDKLMILADYASGDNAIGGGGVGVGYYFTPDVAILTGPVWFNDKDLNGEWKWTVQVDVNVRF